MPDEATLAAGTMVRFPKLTKPWSSHVVHAKGVTIAAGSTGAVYEDIGVTLAGRHYVQIMAAPGCVMSGQGWNQAPKRVLVLRKDFEIEAVEEAPVG